MSYDSDDHDGIGEGFDWIDWVGFSAAILVLICLTAGTIAGWLT